MPESTLAIEPADDLRYDLSSRILRSGIDMDVFNRRISIAEAATIIQQSLDRKYLGAASSSIIHHLGMMHERVTALQATFPASALHAIAIKANPVVEVLRELVHAGAGLEAASIEEVELAFAAGCPIEKIVFDSPAKTHSEIEQALHWGIYLNADNFAELVRIAARQEKQRSASQVGLRVNPLVGGGTIASTSVSLQTSKFGVRLSTDRQRILQSFAEYDWLTGLHVHVGSQGCQLELLAEAAYRISQLQQEIQAQTGRLVRTIDIGGGLPTAYHDRTAPPGIERYEAALREHAPGLFAPNVRLITELGRAVQANCGIAVSRVEYVKPAERLAVIHLGADFLLRTAYRPEDWSHELFVMDSQGREKYGDPTPQTIAGPLCFAGDIVARDAHLPPIEPGDWIVIRDVGAYTLSMWSRHCNRSMPAVIGYDPRQPEPLRLLRRAESPGDIARFWSLGAGTGF